jgi:hypothetical protein
VGMKRVSKKFRKKLFEDMHISNSILDTLKIFSELESDDEDETDDTLYEYIDLVFPPNSTPPTRDSANKKINLANFNQIHKMIC